MNIPSLAQAQAFLREAAALNPGPWVAHSEHVAAAAQALAAALPPLDADAAYIMGLLHDIGRRAGKVHQRHALEGYLFMQAQGYEDAARICMTHSFHCRNVRDVFGPCDLTPAELAFVADHVQRVPYDDYDRLLQLCDALALATGCCLMEKRLVDVALRYGMEPQLLPKWHKLFEIKRDFEQRLGCSLYTLLPGVVENTFEAPRAALP
jgi:hypothetical protein